MSLAISLTKKVPYPCGDRQKHQQALPWEALGFDHLTQADFDVFLLDNGIIPLDFGVVPLNNGITMLKLSLLQGPLRFKTCISPCRLPEVRSVL